METRKNFIPHACHACTAPPPPHTFTKTHTLFKAQFHLNKRYQYLHYESEKIVILNV